MCLSILIFLTALISDSALKVYDTIYAANLVCYHFTELEERAVLDIIYCRKHMRLRSDFNSELENRTGQP